MPEDSNAATRSSPLRETVSDGMRAFRRFGTFLIVITLAVIVAWIGGHELVHEKIRRYVEQALNAELADRDYRVEIGAARFLPNEGIRFSDIQLLTEKADGSWQRDGSIDRMVIHSDAGILQLIRGQVQVTNVEIHGLFVHAKRDPAGNWNLARLLPLPETSNTRVPVTINDAQVKFEVDDGRRVRHTVLTKLRTRVVWGETPIELGEDTDSSSAVVEVSHPIDAETEYNVVSFEGGFVAERIEEFAFRGSIDLANGLWTLGFDTDGFELGEHLLAYVPNQWADQANLLSSFHGKLAADGSFQGDLAMQQPIRVDARGSITEGRAHHDRLPYPLHSLSADFSINNDGFDITRAEAFLGRTRVELTSSGGFTEAQPLRLEAKGQRVTLDGAMARALPEQLQQSWSDFSPNGTADVNLTLTLEDGQWQHDVHMELLNVSIKPRAFPYQVDGCLGEVHWYDGRCDVDVRGFASGRMMTFQGTVFKDPAAPSQIRVRLPKPIPLDEKLMKALTNSPRVERAVRAFHGTGMITCDAIIGRGESAADLKLEWIQIDLHDFTVRHDRFPYPFHGVAGSVIYENEKIVFQNLKGHNDGGTVFCSGTYVPNGVLNLALIGSAIPLEDDLRGALSTAMQHTWQNLQPRGVLDHLIVGLTYDPTIEKVTLDIDAEQYKGQHNRLGQSVSIRPAWLPLQLNNVTGAIHYRDGQITINNLEAVAGSARFSASGVGHVDPQGWSASFQNLAIDGLQMNESFLSAVPTSLGESIRKMRPKGQINVLGGLTISAQSNFADTTYGPRYQDGPNADFSPQIVLDWDLTVDMENGSLDLGRPVRNIHGGVRLIGHRDSRGTIQDGMLSVDSMMIEGIQLTRVRGPIQITANEILVGAWASMSRPQEAPQPLTASFSGGKLMCDARVSLAEQNPFRLQAWLEDGDLAQLVNDLGVQASDVSGRVYGFVDLAGSAVGSESLQGEGLIRLVNAKIYEIPVMLSLLKVLSIRQPDRTAFTNSNFDFRIVDEHIYFERLEFIGDAISLKGNGEMDFDKNIDLQFYSVVGRNEVDIPVLSNIFGAASQSILLIEVSGTIDNPDIKQNPFPAINETLQHLFPEAESGNEQRIVPGIPSLSEMISPTNRVPRQRIGDIR